MAEYMDYAEYVADVLETRDLLEQLAEEASELSHAALKLIRAAEMNYNTTNVDEAQAIDNLVEEFIDVKNSYCTLRLAMYGIKHSEVKNTLEGLDDIKMGRWAKRLGFKEK